MNLWQSFLKISLWIASIGLMVASSGLDGAYLSKLMPENWAWLGLVLNTVADVTSELGMYWYGRLQMDKSATKRKRARWLLVGQVVLVGYAWLFSWRQLVPIISKVDPDAWWMAPIGAAFIPAALIVVGYIQALLAGRIESAVTEKPAAQVAQVVTGPTRTEQPMTATLATGAAMLGVELSTEQETTLNELDPAIRDDWPVAQVKDFRAITAGMNGDRASLDAKLLKKKLARRYKRMPSASTVRRWLAEARKGELN